MDPQTSPYYGYDSQKPQLYDSANRNKKMFFIVIGIFVFLIIITILLSLTSSTARGDIALVGARHGELSRVADLALDSTSSSVSTKNSAASIRIHGIDSRNEVSDYIAKAIGGGVTAADLTAVKNSEVDSFLTTAASRNTYDTDFNEVMIGLIQRARDQAVSAKALHDDPAFHALMDAMVEEDQVLLDSLGATE